MTTRKKGKQGQQKRAATKRVARKGTPRAGQPSVAAVMDQMLQAGKHSLDEIIKATGASRGRVVAHLAHRKRTQKAHIVESKDGTLKWNSAGR